MIFLLLLHLFILLISFIFLIFLLLSKINIFLLFWGFLNSLLPFPWGMPPSLFSRPLLFKGNSPLLKSNPLLFFFEGFFFINLFFPLLCKLLFLLFVTMLHLSVILLLEFFPLLTLSDSNVLIKSISIFRNIKLLIIINRNLNSFFTHNFFILASELLNIRML